MKADNTNSKYLFNSTFLVYNASPFTKQIYKHFLKSLCTKLNMVYYFVLKLRIKKGSENCNKSISDL